MNIATYGTLRKGMTNFKSFEHGLEYLETVELTGYKLWKYMHLPIVTRTGMSTDKVTVDLMFVDTVRTSRQIDTMELRANYYIDMMLWDDKPYKLYLYSYTPDSAENIEHGNWKRYVEENGKPF